MLKALQIQELVKGGEGYNVDFKRSVPSKVKEISDEVMFLSELIIIIRLLAQRLITINVLPFKIRLVKFLLH